MKKLATMLKIATVMAVALLLGGGCDDGIDWLGLSRGNFVIDDEITTCFNLVNEFRTGNEAWYYSDDTKNTKTELVGKLKELTLDENLCKAAAIRAKEIVKSFSHTRPNGKDCFTVFDDLGIKAGYKAENIAMGNTSGAKTFNQWKEDDLPNSQQGHRINMLSPNATKIGIAHDSSGRYWAMILSN